MKQLRTSRPPSLARSLAMLQMHLHEQRKLWLRVQELSNRGLKVKQENRDAQLKLTKAEEADIPLEVRGRCTGRRHF